MYPGHWASIKPAEKAVTLTGADGVEVASLTWQTLDDRSNQIAQYLYRQGLRKDDHIAIFMENHLAWFEVAWAAMRSGLWLTPVNRYLTAEEAGYIVDNCDAKACISSARLADIAVNMPAYAPGCTLWMMVDGLADGFQSLDAARDASPAEPLAEQPTGAFMFYSSGTTGHPKGVARTLPDKMIHEEADSPTAGLQSLLWGVNESTVYLSPAPLYHAAPLSFSIATQTVGARVVVMPRFDAVDALAAIEKHQVTHSQWVPTMFTRMLKLDESVRNSYDLSSHKVAIHAAAPCPREVKRQMMDWWGPIIYEYYAGSEANGFTHANPQEWLARPGTVGKSLLGQIHICDEQGNELAAGEQGLVYFELPPEMAYGYYKDEQKTRDSQHPAHPNWTTLGDVGYLDEDNYLFLTDRATFMIVSGGVNIYPQEVEDQLILHPAVDDVAVLGVPDEEMGEAVKAVVQVVQGRMPDEALEKELLEFVRERLAHYKCPKSIDFDPQLPRLPTGKLYKRLLKDRYWGSHDSRIL